MRQSLLRTEPLFGSGPRLCCLLFSVARGGLGFERIDKPPGDSCHVPNSPIECTLIDLRRLCKSADLADKLDCSGLNFFVGCRRLKIEQGSNVSAHIV